MKKEWQRGEEIAQGVTALLRKKLESLVNDMAKEKIVSAKQRTSIQKGLLNTEKAVKRAITAGIKNTLKVKHEVAPKLRKAVSRLSKSKKVNK
ncbi:MAG: hypothetical protein WCO03_02600 [bacterium]